MIGSMVVQWLVLVGCRTFSVWGFTMLCVGGLLVSLTLNCLSVQCRHSGLIILTTVYAYRLDICPPFTHWQPGLTPALQGLGRPEKKRINMNYSQRGILQFVHLRSWYLYLFCLYEYFLFQSLLWCQELLFGAVSQWFAGYIHSNTNLIWHPNACAMQLCWKIYFPSDSCTTFQKLFDMDNLSSWVGGTFIEL